MRIVFLVEGASEHGIKPLVRSWLDSHGKEAVGIKTVDLGGSGTFLREVGTKVGLHAESSGVIGVIGLLDLYRFPLRLRDGSPAERVAEATDLVTSKVPQNHRTVFRQHFAVQELEAWLFSDHSLFPFVMPVSYANRAPETINDVKPPSRHLDELYRKHTRRGFAKTQHGPALFSKLDPAIAAAKCPNLMRMLSDVLSLTQNA